MYRQKIYFVRPNLAICGYAGIGSRQQFESFGFKAHLQCTDLFDSWLQECVEVRSLPFMDGFPIPRNIFHEAQNWLSNHWKQEHKILVSCAAGQSRSVTMGLSCLHLQTKTGFLEAAQEVMSKVPSAYPHPITLVSAATYCNVPLNLNQLQTLYRQASVQPVFPWSEELLKAALTLPAR